MIPESIGAVLMIGHFIVSIFNVQLGAPVIYTMPFETMEQCEFYSKLLPTDVKIDLEWKHITRYQCFTIEEFQQMQQQQQQQQQGTAPGPQKPNSDRGV
jgi:hypothetical protein